MPATGGRGSAPRWIYGEPAGWRRGSAESCTSALACRRRCGYASACEAGARLCGDRADGVVAPALCRLGARSRDGATAARRVARNLRSDGSHRNTWALPLLCCGASSAFTSFVSRRFAQAPAGICRPARNMRGRRLRCMARFAADGSGCAAYCGAIPGADMAMTRCRHAHAMLMITTIPTRRRRRGQGCGDG